MQETQIQGQGHMQYAQTRLKRKRTTTAPLETETSVSAQEMKAEDVMDDIKPASYLTLTKKEKT